MQTRGSWPAPVCGVKTVLTPVESTILDPKGGSTCGVKVVPGASAGSGFLCPSRMGGRGVHRLVELQEILVDEVGATEQPFTPGGRVRANTGASILVQNKCQAASLPRREVLKLAHP